MRKVVVAASCRTPIGRVPGSMSSMNETQMLSSCFSEIANRNLFDVNKIDSAYVGCAFPSVRTNLCRVSLLDAGLPGAIPGTTIVKTCTSSMEAIAQGAYKIMAGDAEAVLIGGVESMSNSPYVLSYLKKIIKSTYRGQLPHYNSAIENIEEDDMQLIAEMIARNNKITRKDLDENAKRSHKRALFAKKNGFFSSEIQELSLIRDNENKLFKDDECIQDEIDSLAMTQEDPFYIQDGILTKLNSAPIADAAAAMVLMSDDMAKKEGIKPLAEIYRMAEIGVPREKTGYGTVEAINSLLAKNKFSSQDIDLWECIEVPATQAILVQRRLDLDPDKLNVNGGCIALGHPVGCTGLRISITLIFEMRRRQVELGIAAGSAGGGIGQAIMFRCLG